MFGTTTGVTDPRLLFYGLRSSVCMNVGKSHVILKLENSSEFKGLMIKVTRRWDFNRTPHMLFIQ